MRTFWLHVECAAWYSTSFEVLAMSTSVEPRRRYAAISMPARGSNMQRARPRPRSGIGLSALLRRRHDPDIGFRRLPALRIELLGLVVGHRAGEDDVLALLPVRRRRHAVLGGELQRVDDAQHFVEIAPRGHRINQDQLDLLVRPDDEDIAH